MNIPGSYRGIRNQFEEESAEIRGFFEHLPNLLNAGFPYDVAIAYLFSLVELAHNCTLYYGAVKLHHCHPDVTWSVIDSTHMTRSAFRERFKVIFGEELDTTVAQNIEKAEKVRDRIVHGKSTAEAAKREAIVSILEYANGFNKQVYGLAGFKPFGQDMRGFKGRAASLDKTTTHWVLKGMGLLNESKKG
jgi:hypothetical protein